MLAQDSGKAGAHGEILTDGGNDDDMEGEYASGSHFFGREKGACALLGLFENEKIADVHECLYVRADGNDLYFACELDFDFSWKRLK